MRKRWNLRWRRHRRDSRPLSTPEMNAGRQRRFLIFVMILLAFALWGILAVRLATSGGIQAGSPSSLDVRAPYTSSFASELLTEKERIRVESAPDAVVYVRDPAVPTQQRTQLADLLQTIGQIRDDPSLNAPAKRTKLESLPLPNSTLVISPELATQITALSEDAWSNVRRGSLDLYERALSAYNYELSEKNVQDLRDRSLPYWSSLVASGEEQGLILLFGSSFIRPNRLLDNAATEQRKQELRDAVKPIMVTVQEGESIVHAGDIVTPEIEEKLEAYGVLQSEVDWIAVGGKALFAALIATIFGLYLYKMQRSVWQVRRPLMVVAAMFALTALAARLVLPFGVESLFAFPLAIIALLLATLFPRGLALMTVTLLGLILAFLSNGQSQPVIALLIGCYIGIMTIGRGERWLHFVLAGAIVAGATALANAVFWLTSPGGFVPEQGLQILRASGINGAATAFFSLGLYNLVGHLADVATPQQLMELAHPNHPLLRKLIREAPGTYYHSVAVGNLAESAAEAIGADALLLRVASYYHDIGKTVRPFFYTDNQSDRDNVHNELDPHTSAEIICEHVSEGVKMARNAGLPRQIVEFIPAHHGTSVIKHFYQLALQQEDSVNIDDYRYPGPKPQTREQAIMMLSDSVEATVRAKAQNGKIAWMRDDHSNGNGRGQNGTQTIEELVNGIIDERVRSGQLDECDLTLRDIARIRHAYVNSLHGIYHPRVDYTPQVVKPA